MHVYVDRKTGGLRRWPVVWDRESADRPPQRRVYENRTLWPPGAGPDFAPWAPGEEPPPPPPSTAGFTDAVIPSRSAWTTPITSAQGYSIPPAQQYAMLYGGANPSTLSSGRGTPSRSVTPQEQVSSSRSSPSRDIMPAAQGSSSTRVSPPRGIPSTAGQSMPPSNPATSERGSYFSALRVPGSASGGGHSSTQSSAPSGRAQPTQGHSSTQNTAPPGGGRGQQGHPPSARGGGQGQYSSTQNTGATSGGRGQQGPPSTDRGASATRGSSNRGQPQGRQRR